MKRILSILLLMSNYCFAQSTSCSVSNTVPTNNIVITTGYNPSTQTSLAPGQNDSSWIVTAMSSDMQTAFCNNNTFTPGGPANAPGVAPAAIGQPAWVIQPYSLPWIQTESYLSCFPYNTMFTVLPAASNITNCTMDITRSFYISGASNQNVTFNFSVSTDDETKNITVDAGTPGAILLSSGGVGLIPLLNINTTISLAPGSHTLTIQAANGEDVNGLYYPIPSGAEEQWNPFGVAVVGNITSSSNVLQNKNCCTPTYSTIDTTICTGQSYLGHNTTGTYIDTITNVAGCDSIQTVNLTVGSCTVSCNNWLQNTTTYSGATIGNLGVTGNQLTVEAEFNSSVPLATTGYDPAIVSKHSDPPDCNFVLRTDIAELSTTTNGLAIASAPCVFEANKTYHVAMVYDGATLKFYRDGFLMSSVPQSGNMVSNSWLTTIGEKAGGAGSESLIGYINEVRIWNVARTQAQLRAYMNTSLPNPATQPGLMAYYTFNTLSNNEGNSTYNGTTFGSATINETNPQCSLVPDSCCTPTNSTIDTTLYTGQTYLGHSTAGTYIDTITNVAGCDSIRTVNITINNNCSILNSAASNNIIINTGYNPVTQTSVAIGQQDPVWTVTALTADMQNAPCYENTTAAQGPTPGKLPVAPVGIGQNPYVCYAAGFVSCFPYNTIYTPQVSTGNITNCQMTIRRKFFINSNSPQPVTFNFSIAIDDYVGSVIVDAGTSSPVVLFNNTAPPGNAGQTINSTITLAPGAHTLDIVCANWEQPNAVNQGAYYTVNGTLMQWNPFAAKVTGNITSPGNVLQNIFCCIPTYSTLDTTICTGQSYLGHNTTGSFNDTLANAAGCDSIITINLTVHPCTVICKSSFAFTSASQSIVSITATPPATTNQLYNANANGFTWEAWFQLTGPIINQSLIMSTEDPVPYQDIFLGFGFGGIPDALSFSVADDGANNAVVAVQSSQALTIGTWYHVAAVCDYGNAQLLLYLNGNLIATQPIPANIVNNRLGSNHLVQLGNASERGNGIDANIDEVQFWDTARTQTEIQNSFNQCVSLPQTGLVAYFKADENGGTTAYSSVNNSFTGTLQSTGWATQVPTVNCSAVSITDSSISCSSFVFKGSVSNPASINSWQWSFDDGTTASGQNASHNFSVAGNHTAKLIATNTNGCSDSNTVTITSSSLTVNAGNDSLVCKNSSFTLSGTGTNIVQYAWSPKTYLNDSTLQNPTASITNTTKFYLAATNAAGCTGIDSVTITVQNVPVKTNNDTAVCSGNTVQLNTIGASIYSWSPSAGLTNAGIANPVDTSTIANTTQYIVTGTSAIGCSANDTVNITINPNPVIQTNNDTTVCNGGSVQLNTAGANTYSWSPITNLNNTAIANPIATPINTIKYFVTGTISNTGCFAKDSVTITTNPKPTIIKSDDTSICNNTSVQLLANGGITYQWSPTATLTNPAINNPVATPTGNTTYYVTVTDANSCSNNDSIKVSIRPNPVFTVIPDTLVCSLNAVQLYASGGDIYSWSPASLVSNPNISNPLSNTTTTTSYTVSITESTCNVSATLTTNLTLAPPLTINISKSNDIDCSDGSAQLLATGAVTYSWLPAGGLNNNDTTIANPIVSPLITQQYVVKGDDPSTGCIGYDSVTVYVNFADNNNAYLMATAFTPNNDGLNDCYGIKNWGVLEKLDFSIYNRWGTLIFHTNDPADCWDGTYQGQPCDIDTYIYVVKASTPCGNVFRKGNLTLLR
jgi:gliding motility-associated-like protein